MNTITDYALTPIAAEQISATSLRNEVESTTDERFECFRIQSSDTAETGWVAYSEGRAGVAWGGDTQWTDADSAEDAVERFLGLNEKEMVN